MEPAFLVATFVCGTHLVICRSGRVYEISPEDPHMPLIGCFDAWDVRLEGDTVRVYLDRDFYIASRIESSVSDAFRRVAAIVRSSKLA